MVGDPHGRAREAVPLNGVSEELLLIHPRNDTSLLTYNAGRHNGDVPA
ncbi:hypothetical protein [Actinopolymorpha alba]|nr:hypothetical protein [Actinopolymorpha alba]